MANLLVKRTWCGIWRRAALVHLWTNEESDDAAVTTVTFEEKDDTTLLVLHELYSSKEALDAAIEGMEGGMPEQFEQLDQLLVALGAGAGGS
jgi:cytochrome oxidase Cu insertion factor (SCO1/SenC/PrrC family)